MGHGSCEKVPATSSDQRPFISVINTSATITKDLNCEHFPGRLTKYRFIYHSRAVGLLLRVPFLFVSAIIIPGARRYRFHPDFHFSRFFRAHRRSTFLR